MELRYDVFELDARGRRRSRLAADEPLSTLHPPARANRLEAQNTNRDGHYCHWDGVEWQPCPHPIHMARSSLPAGALISNPGQHRHYARAVDASRVLARSGVTVAEVDSEGITLVVHARRSDGDDVEWEQWCRDRLAEARERRLGGAQEISIRWRDLEAAIDGPDSEQAMFYAVVYDIATGFRAAHDDSDSPAVMRPHTVVPDLFNATA
jgi:hypothetical protein